MSKKTIKVLATRDKNADIDSCICFWDLPTDVKIDATGSYQRINDSPNAGRTYEGYYNLSTDYVKRNFNIDLKPGEKREVEIEVE